LAITKDTKLEIVRSLKQVSWNFRHCFKSLVLQWL